MRLVAIALALSLVSGVCFAQDESSANAEQFSKLAYSDAREYVIETHAQTLELVDGPVLKWTNPQVGEIYGDTFLWSDRGRPMAVGTFYKWYRPYTHMTHEFQSLSARPLLAKRDGQPDWDTKMPGLVWRDIPGAPAVRSTPPQRLVQMRGLARQFSAQMKEKDQSRSKLRLLSQPLHRYSSTAHGISDGAVFAFAKGTDPELMLLIEAREKDDRWQYGFARMNNLSMEAMFGDDPVWSVEFLSWRQSFEHDKPFTKFQFDDE